MGDTMLDILLATLPRGVRFVNCKEKSQTYSIVFGYEEHTATAELPKTCGPNSAVKVCKQCIATAMSTIMLNKGDFVAASRWLEWPYKKELSKQLSVCKLIETSPHSFKYEALYEDIETVEEAYILSQLAMTERDDLSELIFIFPGRNTSINTRQKEYEYALELKEKYEVKKND